MIYTDGIHLISDFSIYELHDFAKKIGLKRSRYHRGHSRRHPHYDLTLKCNVQMAVRLGAKQVSVREIARKRVIQ